MISVEICPPSLSVIDEWDALAARAAANAFMHPAALCAAAETGFAQVHVLLARDDGKLVGFWALRERRLVPFCRFLAAPPYDYAFVSSPIVDPHYADAVMPALLGAIADARKLPNVLQLKLIDGGADTFRATMAALTARGGPVLTLSERARPYLSGEAERKRSGSTAKKLRQDWNRLNGLGAVEVTNARDAADVRAAFEIFLTMEAKSWKGAGGTALLSNDEDAAFTRALIGTLSEHGAASVGLLRVEGQPVAAQVLLYAGTTAYTWKTAFDAEFAKFSPGVLLLDRLTDMLFADGIAQIESCSPAGSFMEKIWSGRRTTVDLLADVGPRPSAAFRLIALAERVRAVVRQKRDLLRGISWFPQKRKSVAVTRS